MTVRSWMYHLLFLVAAIAAIGVFRTKKTPHSKTLIIFYLFFWLGQLYNVLLLFLAKGASTSMGWYMYCVIAAEVGLLVIGLGRFFPVLILMFAALDLYTVDLVSIPYYTGMIAHRPDGALQNLHLSSWADAAERLSSGKPAWLNPAVLETAWVLYAAATLGVIAVFVADKLMNRCRFLPKT